MAPDLSPSKIGKLIGASAKQRAEWRNDRFSTTYAGEKRQDFGGATPFKWPRQWSSGDVNASTAQQMISLMKPPISIHVDTYSFVNKNCCYPLLKSLLAYVGVPNCNSLWTGGVTWPKSTL